MLLVLLITIIAIIAVSYLAGIVWFALFSATLPSYASGIIGGIAALPIWEVAKRARARWGKKKES